MTAEGEPGPAGVARYPCPVGLERGPRLKTVGPRRQEKGAELQVTHIRLLEGCAMWVPEVSLALVVGIGWRGISLIAGRHQVFNDPSVLIVIQL